MADTTNLILNFFSASGAQVDDKVTISLKHFRLSDSRIARNKSTLNSLRIADLMATHTGIYLLDIEPRKHRAVRQNITLPMGQDFPMDVKLFIDSNKISAINFPSFRSQPADLQDKLNASQVGGKGGEALYNSLKTNNRQLAGLLNICSKMRGTKTVDGSDVFSFIESFRGVDQDRFFANVSPGFQKAMEESERAGLFDLVDGSLHKIAGFDLAKSYKSKDDFGNLQVTFFVQPGTGAVVVDADIDESSGLDHFFVVLDHGLTGGKTDPFLVNQLLLGQGIDPGYEILV